MKFNIIMIGLLALLSSCKTDTGKNEATIRSESDTVSDTIQQNHHFQQSKATKKTKTKNNSSKISLRHITTTTKKQ